MRADLPPGDLWFARLLLWGGGLLGEELAEAGSERVDPDALQRKGAGVSRVKLPSSLRGADADPVGGLVTGTLETLLLDEGLQQDGSVAVAVLPIKREQACSHAQQLRGEVPG